MDFDGFQFDNFVIRSVLFSELHLFTVATFRSTVSLAYDPQTVHVASYQERRRE